VPSTTNNQLSNLNNKKMRLFILSLLLTGFTTLQAQTITGVAKDDAGAPLAGASVALVKAKDTAVVKLAVAGGNGSYSFTGIPQGDYRILLSNVGYNNALSAPFQFENSNVTAPSVAATKAAAGMQGCHRYRPQAYDRSKSR
jgi:hypothetical protein